VTLRAWWYLNNIPRQKELATGLFKCLFQYIGKDEGQDGPEELWKPYSEEIANQTIDAAKKGSDQHVVLTHATCRQAWREFVVKKLIEGGVKEENITVLYLTINPDVKLKGFYWRTKEQIENGGMTLGDHMRTKGWEGEGDITLPEYMAFMKEKYPQYVGNDTFQEIPDGYGKTVDVSGRDMSHLDGVDGALGLVGKRNDKTLTFEEIRDKVKAFEQRRDEKMASTGSQDELLKIFAEIKSHNVTNGDDNDNDNDNENNGDEVVNNTEEELEKIANAAQDWSQWNISEHELHRSSLSSIDDEKKKIMKTRRSSLIKTGNIE
jgi:hypothetical protein